MYLHAAGFCRDNCDTKSPGGPCTTCYNGYEPPDCCSCPSNKTEVDKEICSKHALQSVTQ